MNKKIKEFYLKSLDENQDFCYQEFAKLIVQDCLSIMKNCDGDLDFAIWKTKQDFGVKE